jgi:activator of HSP90 ATPase
VSPVSTEKGFANMSSIHHEVTFPATPSRVYKALIDSKEFGQMTGASATGDGTEGAAFSGFGGHITGRHVELVPDKRVVQAWRAKTWPEGTYSIVKFELFAEGNGTKLVFDHAGFPEDAKEHLSQGWHANYWEKIAKHVS